MDNLISDDDKFISQISEWGDELTIDEIELLRRVHERHKNDPVLSKIKELNREDLLRVLNGTYIAERFFGKSGSWFSQKLNRNLKNGKPCDFTPDERATLADALDVISCELANLADEFRY
ncbi:MAG: DUF5053 domain-containing protein [Muribaculaceae bacterium]|nr:DUF5053 domain-containing protein [Muribaculaceae bacterium]